MNQEEINKIRNEEMPDNYYPPKDLANVIWGQCFSYQDLDKNDIREKIKTTCFYIEKIYKIQEMSKKK